MPNTAPIVINPNILVHTPDVGSVGLDPSRHRSTTEVRNNTTTQQGRNPEGSVGSVKGGKTNYLVKTVCSNLDESKRETGIAQQFKQANRQVSAVISKIWAQ